VTRYRADRSLSWHGQVLLGGSPLRLFRLSETGARVVHAALDGTPPRGSAARGLLDRLVDAGAVHPDPDGPGPWSSADVTAVIPVLDPDRERLCALVESLQSDGVAEVIVVDDAGTPALAPVPGARVVRRAVNGGPGAARVTGLGEVTTPLVAFVDADVTVPPGWLHPLLAQFADPEVALVAPRVRSRPGPGRLARYEEAHSPLDLGDESARIRAGTRVSYVPTAAVVVRRDALGAIGGFDPALRTGEDVDAVWRLDESGYRCRYEPAVEVLHEPRPTWASWVRQRRGYGRSAGPLARRHRGAVPPVAVSGWSAAVWGTAVLAPFPAGAVTAVATAGATAVALQRRIGSWPLAVRLTGLGHLHAGRQLASAVRRAWWPVLVPVALWSRWARRVLVLAALDGLRRGGPIRLADDAAYAVGVWEGAWRARTVAPLAPDLTSWPRPSRYERRRGDGSDRSTPGTPTPG
jgi:mycofactocin system glycosyltransferase